MYNSTIQNDIIIQYILPDVAAELCEKITASLPEWFGQPDVNKQYIKGMQSRFSIAAVIDTRYVGLITLEFPYPNNANIYWLGVLKEFHNRGIGKQLIQAAEKYACDKDIKSLTVETLSKVEKDINYFKTYNFYLNSGFLPLFDLKPYGPDQAMVYMYKALIK